MSSSLTRIQQGTNLCSRRSIAILHSAVPPQLHQHTSRSCSRVTTRCSSSSNSSSSSSRGSAASTSTAEPSAIGAQAAIGDAGLESFKALIGERRFTCTMCGKCCTGSGEVWISQEEIVSIAKHLGMSLPRFNATYTKPYARVEGWRMLKSTAKQNCIFLADDNSCKIHSVRPTQCSTYPWWPELTKADEWAWEKENICEGFDHAEAPPTDMVAAAAQLRISTAHSIKRLLATPAKVGTMKQELMDEDMAELEAVMAALPPVDKQGAGSA